MLYSSVSREDLVNALITATHCPGLDVTLHQLPRDRVNARGTRAVDHAIGDDGLGKDACERRGRVLGEDSGLRHCVGWFDVCESDALRNLGAEKAVSRKLNFLLFYLLLIYLYDEDGWRMSIVAL